MRVKLFTLLVAAGVILTACGGGGGGTPSPTPVKTPDAATRPSSPAVLSIVSPTSNQVITGGTLHVMVSLQKAMIVQATSSNIRPDQGHVHLYLDNRLIYMQYSLQQDVPVQPGVYQLKAEFVASDHFPFSPRVWSPVVIFTVH